MKGRQPRAKQPAAKQETDEPPDLPVYKAFVVQFTRETRAPSGVFAGRIEHMSSGRRARFESAHELLAALEKLLDQLGEKQM